MALNDELKRIALQYGEDVYNKIYLSTEDLSQKIDGEVLDIYEEFRDWGLLDKYPIKESASHEFYVTIIAMQKYRHLRWQKAHPARQKPSKWEIVTGGARRRRH